MTGVRLLVLDDDPSVGETIVGMAELAGHEACCVTGPAAFLELNRTWRPTHLALDLVQPGVDGVDVLGRLAEEACTAAIIIFSGVDRRVIQSASTFATENGLHIVGVLATPFDTADLQAVLDRPRAPTAGTRGAGADPVPKADDLARALTDPGEIWVAYQPKVRCDTGRLAGFEALARWTHPVLGPVSPEVFIPIAERNGLVGPLTQRVVEDSLRWYAALDSRRVSLSINLSAVSLRDDDLVERLTDGCRRHGVEPNGLVLELTETTRHEDHSLSLRQATRLRVYGFQLSADDFGIGYSSMSELVRLPFSEIKVDRMFVLSALTSADSLAMVRSAIELGQRLGLTTTSEGVEDRATLDLVRELGSDLVQGFHISRPMVGAEAAGWGPAPETWPPD